ncbi:uncharacterized protein METZ01_LOCUS177655, partial [marine metagenome]
VEEGNRVNVPDIAVLINQIDAQDMREGADFFTGLVDVGNDELIVGL